MKQIRMAWTYAVACLTMCMANTIASAQVTHHVAWSKIETGPWTLTPIYAEENGVPGAVVSFLALADPSATLGDNLVAVWYQRDPTGWSAKSWETTDPWEAIKSVKQEMGFPDVEDERWGIPGSDAAVTNAEQPKDYSEGVLANDPLATLVSSSPDRDAIVDFLTTVGYKAADVPVEKDDGCTTNARLDGMAAATAETLVGDEATAVDRSMTAWIASGSAGCGIGAVAVEIVTFPPRPTTPWGPPTYWCYTNQDGFLWTHCKIWTETRTLTQKRTRARFNPAPPPTYQYCDQTRTGTQTQTTSCCSSGVIPVSFPPTCPTVPPGTTPAIGAGCTTALGAPVISPFVTWGAWGPACPF
ncbi:MAG: hypothetical protein ACK4WH_13815 [Phycisphaerales bacterium]